MEISHLARADYLSYSDNYGSSGYRNGHAKDTFIRADKY